jgi:hypothetical protein
MAIPKPGGPPPKRESQRRRENKPASYGAAVPETAEAGAKPAELGVLDPHPLITDLWAALGRSAEAKYYSEADWQRVRLELSYGNRLLTGGRIGSQAWAVFQNGLNELLISPADKRRAGIELKPPATDPDEEAAVLQIAEYQANLTA